MYTQEDLNAAIAAERERCAIICEDYAIEAMFDGDPEADHEGAAQHCADLIRAKG